MKITCTQGTFRNVTNEIVQRKTEQTYAKPGKIKKHGQYKIIAKNIKENLK